MPDLARVPILKDLPIGVSVMVGSAVIKKVTPRKDLHEWHLGDIERAKKLRKPNGHPQPVWFKPFGDAPGHYIAERPAATGARPRRSGSAARPVRPGNRFSTPRAAALTSSSEAVPLHHHRRALSPPAVESTARTFRWRPGSTRTTSLPARTGC